MAVGKKLDEILKSRGLTQKEVADKAGIKPQTLNNLITRDSARADIQILLKICKALSIDMSVFDEDALEEFYQDHPKANPLTISKELTPRQERIVQLFDELTEAQQDNIIGRAELLAEQNEDGYKQEDIG